MISFDNNAKFFFFRTEIIDPSAEQDYCVMGTQPWLDGLLKLKLLMQKLSKWIIFVTKICKKTGINAGNGSKFIFFFFFFPKNPFTSLFSIAYEGFIKQFVSMPKGSGHSIEQQVTGEGFRFFSKTELFFSHKNSHQNSKKMKFHR